MIKEIKDTSKVAQLYKDWDETCVLSCLQGVMGKVYAPEGEAPECAVCILGDFAFYAGKPSEELVMYKPPHKAESHFIIMVGDSEGWDDIFQKCYGDKCKLHVRYAIRKDTRFDLNALENIVKSVPDEYTLKFIDEKLYNYCINNDWCRDFVSNFDDYNHYKNHGLGVMAMIGNEPVAGASSYSYYNDGIEIEIVTREEYRRRGLATCVGAKLVLECCKKGIYPSWDAANLNSVGISKKLGYIFNHEYNSYEVCW